MGSSHDSKTIGKNRVRIRFSDGVVGEIDLSSFAGKGVFAIWNDPEEFAKVFIDPENHTLAWPGGIDLCPETLYRDVMTQNPALKKTR